MELSIQIQPDFSVGKTKEEAWEVIDRCEAAMKQLGGTTKADYLTKHTFTDGLYTRMIYMPAGHLIISEIHDTQHQWVVLSGKASVWTYENNWRTVQAPDHGITEPGTRRLLLIHEDCAWLTMHPILPEETTPEQIMDRILSKRINPYLQLID